MIIVFDTLQKQFTKKYMNLLDQIRLYTEIIDIDIIIYIINNNLIKK